MSSRALPPGPKGVPWLGSLPAVYRDALGWVLDFGHRHGPVSYTRFGPGQIYMLNDPELIEEALIGKHRECIKDRSTRELAALLGNGLLTSDGERWRSHRRLAAPPLQPRRIAGYADVMRACTERVLSSFGDEEVRRIDADMADVTLEIAGKTLLGIDTRGDTERVSQILDAAMAHFGRQFYSWHGLLPPWVPTRARVRFARAVADLDAMLYAVVRRCREGGGDADHLLARLVHARDENGETLSDLEVRDEAVTMLLAGHETTALTLAYACYLLALHPEVGARLRAEVDDVLGERPVAVADLQRMPQLEAVLRETLRLYPPAYIIGREVVTPFEIGGYTVPRQAELLMCPYSVQRDARLYSEPERFAPERWLDGKLDRLPRFAYFPFGGGPRTCIGNHFALMEASIVLASLVQRFELFRVWRYELRIAPAVTLRPQAGGVPVGLKRRRPRAAAGARGVATPVTGGARAVTGGRMS